MAETVTAHGFSSNTNIHPGSHLWSAKQKSQLVCILNFMTSLSEYSYCTEENFGEQILLYATELYSIGIKF